MKKLFLLFLASAFFFPGFSDGTIKENIQFTDMNGKKYDLFELLGKGTYVAVHPMFNG